MPFRVRACTCVEVFKCACVHANCVCAATTFVGCGTTSEKRNLTIAWSALFGLPQPKWCLEKSGTTIPCFNPGDQASSTLFCHTPRSRSSAKFFSILQALSIFCNSRITLSAPGPSGRQHNWLMDAPQSGEVSSLPAFQLLNKRTHANKVITDQSFGFEQNPRHFWRLANLGVQ